MGISNSRIGAEFGIVVTIHHQLDVLNVEGMLLHSFLPKEILRNEDGCTRRAYASVPRCQDQSTS